MHRLGGRIINDIHTVTRFSSDWQRNLLRFTSAVDIARWQFSSRPELSFSAANLETNLFAHSQWRAIEEAQDLNLFWNSHFVLPLTRQLLGDWPSVVQASARVGGGECQTPLLGKTKNSCHFCRTCRGFSLLGICTRCWLPRSANVHSR